jgi:hypothetical protein
VLVAPVLEIRIVRENEIFRTLSVGGLSSTEWIQLDRQFKAIVGFVLLIWPTYGSHAGSFAPEQSLPVEADLI